MTLRSRRQATAFATLLAATSMSVALGSACAKSERSELGGLTPSPTSDPLGSAVDSGTPPALGRDPVTCDEARDHRTYIGCDYWPTVLANTVKPIFDFAVVVANAGEKEIDIEVTGPDGFAFSDRVRANGVAKIFLPWIASLKGPEVSDCGDPPGYTPTSVAAKRGAYHLISSAPVTVYQFNALEYRGAGGPPGKNWNACPTTCSAPGDRPCFSYSNDASLLLPSTALTGNYRVVGHRGWSENGFAIHAPYLAITATEDETVVRVRPTTTAIMPGGGIPGIDPGGTMPIQMDRGDVIELFGPKGAGSDLSGSLVQADKPIQVMTGVPCTNIPQNTAACDHIEETVFPAETLGKHYVVTVPTAPDQRAVGHVVRFYGNVDGTVLSYPSGTEACAHELDAGEVIDCNVTSTDFEVVGSKEFAIASFMLGGSLVDPTSGRGDPSQSIVVPVEQYRAKYVFLAPDDYDVSFADVVAESGTRLSVDGVDVDATAFAPIGTSKFQVARVKLGPGASGAHVLVADRRVGLQVIGYGLYTSYQFPGGLDLTPIAPPPIR